MVRATKSARGVVEAPSTALDRALVYRGFYSMKPRFPKSPDALSEPRTGLGGSIRRLGSAWRLACKIRGRPGRCCLTCQRDCGQKGTFLEPFPEKV